MFKDDDYNEEEPTQKELMDAVIDDSELTGKMYDDESFKDSELKNINEIFSETKDYEAVLDFNAKREGLSGGDRADDVSDTSEDTEDKRVGMINEPNKELGSHRVNFSQEYARLSKELEFDEDGNYVNKMRKEREDEEANEDADLFGTGNQLESPSDLFQGPKPEEISPLDENTVHAHEDDRSGGATASSLDAEDETASVLNDDGFVEKRSGDLETQATETSIAQAVKNAGTTMERARQVAERQGMDLQAVVDAGNLEDMIQDQDQEDDWQDREFSHYGESETQKKTKI